MSLGKLKIKGLRKMCIFYNQNKAKMAMLLDKSFMEKKITKTNVIC